MKEDFLHYVWRYGLYTKEVLYTSQNETVQVLKPGHYNRNSGPDFLQSELIINGQKWVGDVEIHINASDWYVHGHETDKNYDAVILHVVWSHNTEVYMKDNSPLPTLELKKCIPKELLFRYYALYKTSMQWIPCESQIKDVDPFTMQHWLERQYFERLESKTAELKKMLEATDNDWEAVLFQMLARNFGLNVNGAAFLELARSFDFTILRKERDDLHKLNSLLFGQAGFLDEYVEDAYFLTLKKEYTYLKHKYELKSLSKKKFQFFRMRPYNFPTIRIAQLINLYHRKEHLFASVMQAGSLKVYYQLFNIEADTYWNTHLHFGKISKAGVKRLTTSFIDLLIINTILPLKFYFFITQGKQIGEEIIAVIKDIRPEKNQIIQKYSELGVTAVNAMESQALLELKNNYCRHKRCLECAIGNTILKIP